MNILLINHYAGNPFLGMEYRPYNLAREWTARGHNVTILAADFSHLRSNQPAVKTDFQKDNIDGITYIWVKTNKYVSSGYKRILNISVFVLKLLVNYQKIAGISQADAVIASSTYPLDIYPAFLIAKKNKARLIYELHDLWPLSPMIIGNYSKYHPFIRIMQRAENFACRKCDCYVSIIGNAYSYLIKHGLHRNKFVHIPNGFTLNEISDSEKIPSDIEQSLILFKQKYKILIGYAGGHAPSNALKSLLTVSLNYESTGLIGFILIGNGSEKNELQMIVTARNQCNVLFLPAVKKSMLHNVLKQFDILYAGGVKSILHQYGTSFNKIIDYMLAEKPIIFAVDDPNSIVKDARCGLQVSADNANEAIEAIDYLAGLSVEQRMIMGQNGKNYALKNLNYSSLAEKFIDAINRV